MRQLTELELQHVAGGFLELLTDTMTSLEIMELIQRINEQSQGAGVSP